MKHALRRPATLVLPALTAATLAVTAIGQAEAAIQLDFPKTKTAARAAATTTPTAKPTPPAVETTAPPTAGPSWHPHGAQPMPGIQVDVTDPAKGCVILYRGGGNMAAKATHVDGRGQVVTGVTMSAVDPAGDVKASGPAYNVNGDEWHRALHLASTSPTGNWAAVATVSLTSTGGSETKWADAKFCVQRYAYSGYIRTTNDHPYAGTRVTLSAAYEGLNNKGNGYNPVAHRRIHLIYADNNGGEHDYGWATTNRRGVWNKTITAPGGAGELFAVSLGDSQYSPFVSDGILIGSTQG